jgi:hypothetical protein
LLALLLRSRGLSGGLIALAAGVVGWLLPRSDESGDEEVTRLQSDLLLAVSSADPVPLPDLPDDMFERKARFTIVLERPSDETEMGSPLTIEPNLTISPPPMLGRERFPVDEDDDDEAFIWSRRGDDRSDDTPSVPAEADKQPNDGGSTVSRTTLHGDQPDEEIAPGEREARDPADSGPAPPEDEQFVSITRLNEQMGPPAPVEEDDDDGAWWLWFGDGPGGWLAAVAAGFLGGGGTGGAGAISGSEATVTSGLNITFAAGPFIDGKLFSSMTVRKMPSVTRSAKA